MKTPHFIRDLLAVGNGKISIRSLEPGDIRKRSEYMEDFDGRVIRKDGNFAAGSGSELRLVGRLEVMSETWRKQNPRHCPVVLRDGDGRSVGACWHYLGPDGTSDCPSHGRIYSRNDQPL